MDRRRCATGYSYNRGWVAGLAEPATAWAPGRSIDGQRAEVAQWVPKRPDRKTDGVGALALCRSA